MLGVSAGVDLKQLHVQESVREPSSFPLHPTHDQRVDKAWLSSVFSYLRSPEVLLT